MGLGTTWVLVPLALLLGVGGLGLLVDRMVRVPLPGAFILPVGLTALVVVMGVPVLWDASAEWAVPAAGGFAAAGLVVGRPWLRVREACECRWVVAAALGAFAIHASASLLSGQGSIGGYGVLDDAATWLALLDHVLVEGRDTSGVEPSTHARVLESWLAGGYPVGAFLPLGFAAVATGADPAGAFQPVMAVLAALAAVGIMGCVRAFVGRPGPAAAVALLAVQASLLLGYALWGGMKELAAVALLPVLAWATVQAVRGPAVAPALLVVLSGGALTGAFGINGLAWAGVPVAVALLALLRVARLSSAAIVLPASLIAFLPALATLDFVRQTTVEGGGVSAQEDLGNLLAPLSPLQALGLWPTGDFRLVTGAAWPLWLLALAGGLMAVAALAVAVRHRSWTLPALVGIAAIGVAPAVILGSPWIDAKAMAILSPFVLAAAGALSARGLSAGAVRPLAAAAGLVLLAGATASTLLALRDATVAPRERLAELRDVARVAGTRGPLALLDFEPYGSRHFLRAAAAEGVTDLRERLVPDRAGQPFARLATADSDAVDPAALWEFRIVVHRRSPAASRPPGGYRRIWAGPAWEAWERPLAARPPLARLPLGGATAAASVPDCAAVRRLASTPGATRLRASPRAVPVVAVLEAVPPPWQAADGVRPTTDGEGAVTLDVPSAGRWRLWVGGSLRGALSAEVSDREVGRRRHELSYGSAWLRFGTVPLSAGRHEVRLRFRRGGLLAAGRGRSGAQPALGPIALTPAADDAPSPLVVVPRRASATLCDGRAFDWIEAIGDR